METVTTETAPLRPVFSDPEKTLRETLALYPRQVGCGCACCFGGFCGGCGHAGCGGRSTKESC